METVRRVNSRHNFAIISTGICHQSSDISPASVACTPHNNARSKHMSVSCFVKYDSTISAHSSLCIVRGRSDRATDFLNLRFIDDNDIQIRLRRYLHHCNQECVVKHITVSC